jgi:hypothetical protein
MVTVSFADALSDTSALSGESPVSGTFDVLGAPDVSVSDASVVPHAKTDSANVHMSNIASTIFDSLLILLFTSAPFLNFT